MHVSEALFSFLQSTYSLISLLSLREIMMKAFNYLFMGVPLIFLLSKNGSESSPDASP